MWKTLKWTSCRLLDLLTIAPMMKFSQRNANNKITSDYEYATKFELLGISEYAFPLI